jgi:hypothetical protein
VAAEVIAKLVAIDLETADRSANSACALENGKIIKKRKKSNYSPLWDGVTRM